VNRQGLDRFEAARLISRLVRYGVSEPTLRYWEGSGLLPAQSPGRGGRSAYDLPLLVQARVIAELRRENAPLQRIRRALQNFRRLFPDLQDRPGAWHLVVTSRGNVMHVEDSGNLLNLATGQGGWFFVIDGYRFVEDSRRALRAVNG